MPSKTALAKHVEDRREAIYLLCKIGRAAYYHGQIEVAHEYCDSALALATRLDLVDGAVDIHELLGILVFARVDLEESLDRLAYAQALSEQRGYWHGLARSLNVQGEIERARHNYRPAIDCYQASAALFEAEDPAAHMVVKGNLAFALLAVGDVTKAEVLFAQGYRFWEAVYAPDKSALCLTGLAGVQLAIRSYRNAASSLISASRRFVHSDGCGNVADISEYERIDALLRAHLSQDELRSIEERVAREECNAHAKGVVRQSETTALFGKTAAVSCRELEILRLVARGLTDKQIAVQCCISPHTVNSHMRAVYRKLQVNTRSAALHVAHRQGWV